MPRIDTLRKKAIIENDMILSIMSYVNHYRYTVLDL